MNNTDCEHVRLAVMASLDGASDSQPAIDHVHLSTCESCRQWLTDLQSMNARLQGLPYQQTPVDLWNAVESRMRESDERLALRRRLWPIAAAVLAWRALQLFVDLPLPALHPVVALVIAATVWLAAGRPLAIETSAPELKKRGV